MNVPTPAEDRPLSEALRALPMFAALPNEPASCFAALKRGRLESWAPGDVVLAEGAQADLLFVVEGRLSREGSDVVDGEHTGEIDAILHQPASATVTAMTMARTYRVPAPAMTDILSECPLLVRGLLVALARAATTRFAPGG